MKDPAEMIAAVLASMERRTGKTLEQWVAIAQASGIDPLDQNAIRRWLRTEHGLPQNTQWAIADAVARAAGWVEPTIDEYVAAMYAGKKAGLRPIHEATVALGLSVGEGVTIAGRSTYIPLVRTTQFAAVGPGSRGRLVVGMRFRDLAFDDPRIEPVTNFAQATHAAYFTVPDGCDPTVGPPAEEAAQMVAWLEQPLRMAFEQN